MAVKSNFKLDDRIKSINDIQTIICNDYERFIGCRGFFFDEFVQAQNLTKCYYGICADINGDSDDYCFEATDEKSNEHVGRYRFFIPETLLKPVEKTYRPLTKDEFIRMFNNVVFGQWVTIKNIVDNKESCFQIVGYFHAPDDTFAVCFGSHEFSLQTLFDYYRWKDSDGNWRVFGVERKE